MSKDIFIVERKKFLAELEHVALDTHNEMFEGPDEVYNAFVTILTPYELQNPVVFKAEAAYPTPIMNPTRLEVCHDKLFTGLGLSKDKFKDGDDLLVIVAKLPEKPKEKSHAKKD